MTLFETVIETHFETVIETHFVDSMASNWQSSETVVCQACSCTVRSEDWWWHWDVCPMAERAGVAAHEHIEPFLQPVHAPEPSEPSEPPPRIVMCMDCPAVMPLTELERHVCPTWVPQPLRAQHGLREDVEMAPPSPTPGPSRARDPSPTPGTSRAPSPAQSLSDEEMASPPRNWVPRRSRDQRNVALDHRYARLN